MYRCKTYEPRHDKTNNVAVCPAKTQIYLGIRPVWSESSLSAWKKLESLATHWAHREDSDQTEQMPRLIWVLAGHTFFLLVLSWGCSYHYIFPRFHSWAFVLVWLTLTHLHISWISGPILTKFAGNYHWDYVKSWFEPSPEIMTPFVLRKRILSNTHAQPFCGARCLIFGRPLRLLPYFMCTNSEGSGDSSRMRRLAWAFAGRLCDKYHNLMSWLILVLLT